MKLNIRLTLLLIAILAAPWLPSASLSQEPLTRNDNDVLEAVSVKKDLYPANADAKKEIDDALKRSSIMNPICAARL